MEPSDPSLYDHTKAFFESRGQEVCMTRLIYVSSLKVDTDPSHVIFMHRKVVEDVVNSRDANVTGIVIAQSNTIVHLLEGQCHDVLHILTSLASQEDYAHTTQQDRIIYNAEDCPSRYYPEWFSCAVQDKREAVEVNGTTAEEIISTMSSNLFKVGEGIRIDISSSHNNNNNEREETPTSSSPSPSSPSSSPTDLQSASHLGGGGGGGGGEVEFSKYASRLPSCDLVSALSSCDLFLSLSDYLSVFSLEGGGAIDVDLETDKGWPAQPVVYY